MHSEVTRARLLKLLNFGLLFVGWAATVAAPGRLSPERLMSLAVGAVVLALAALLIARQAAWSEWCRGRDRLAGTAARTGLAIVPWLAVFGLIVVRGLWWTQRPAGLRFLAIWVLANWTTAWCLRGSANRSAGRDTTEVPTFALAGLLAVFAVEGLAFGMTPFGCAMSAALALAAASALVLAASGTRTARLGLVAASTATVLAIAVLEGFVRLAHVGTNLQESGRRDLARQFYTLTPPGSAFIVQPTPLDEFAPALIDINSLGIRGPEIPGGRADVLLIGDSFVEARQLPWDRAITHQLQEAFERRAMAVSVAGHGMRGWSPLLEWNWYLKVGRSLQPRDVLLFFFWNDLWTTGDEVETFSAVMRPDGRPDHFDVLVEPSWIWYQHVRVLRILEGAWRAASVDGLRRSIASMGAPSSTADIETLEQRARTQAGEAPLTPDELHAVLTRREAELTPALAAVAASRFWPGMRGLDLWTGAERDAAARTELKLQRFAEDVAADGGRLSIVYVPNPLQVGANECRVGRFFDRVDRGVLLPADSGVQAWLREVSARHDIALIDPSLAMRAADEAPNATPLYLRSDCHWSPAGHTFVANVIADWYRARHAPAAKPATR